MRVAYYKLQGDEQLLDAERQVIAAQAASADAGQRLYDAGNITALERDNNRVALAQAKVDQTRMEPDVADDRAELASLLGLSGDDSLKVSSRLPDLPSEEVELNAVEEMAISQRLDLVAAYQQVEIAARTLGYTDVAVLLNGSSAGMEYVRDPDVKSTIGPQVTIPIPLFDQGQAAVARAEADLRQARDRYCALSIEIRAEVRKDSNRLEASRQQAEFYLKDVLPLRTEIVEETELQYNGMNVSVFTLLQAKQAQIDAGRGYIESLRDYWMARARLEYAIGRLLPVPPITQPLPSNARAIGHSIVI